MNFKNIIPMLVVSGLLLVSNCIKLDTAVASATVESTTGEINFGAVAGSVSVACGTPLSSLSEASESANLQDLRFYVSNIKLIDSTGKEVAITVPNSDWSYTSGSDSVTLIDLEDATGSCSSATQSGTPTMNTKVAFSAPKNTYVGIKFTVGVPSSLNHSNVAVAPKPLDNLAMSWTWASGRKFVKLELAEINNGWVETAVNNTYFYHLGSLGCTGNPIVGETVNCTTPNRTDFILSSFDFNTQRIVLDLKLLLEHNTSLGAATSSHTVGTDHLAKSFKVITK